MHRIAHRLPFTCVLFVVLSSASTPFACATSAVTTTTLTVSSGGSAVTTVTSGSGVTLTAAVTSNSAKVTVGQVNFCDASVTYCTDIHLLGTAQLTSAGTAVLKLAPWVGSHSYKAVFLGTKTVATRTRLRMIVFRGLRPKLMTCSQCRCEPSVTACEDMPEVSRNRAILQLDLITVKRDGRMASPAG